MRAFVVAFTAAILASTPGKGDAAKNSEMQAELEKLQGLWQTAPGGVEHE